MAAEAERDRGKLVAAEGDCGKLVAAERDRGKLVVGDRDQRDWLRGRPREMELNWWRSSPREIGGSWWRQDGGSWWRTREIGEIGCGEAKRDGFKLVAAEAERD